MLAGINFGLIEAADRAVRKLIRSDCAYIPSYCIAGGFIRDIVMGQKPNDIDVVINPHERPQWDVEFETLTPKSDRYVLGGMRAVANTGLSVHGHPIQLIARHQGATPNAIKEYHALALSNAFYFEGQLILDKTFLRSAFEEQHIILDCMYPGADFAGYFEKVLQKYNWPTIQGGMH